jgi:glycosyltransferase involved in cell wall biosynthesis
MKPPCILFLLDWRPAFWSTREEFFRQLCRRLSAKGIVPVVTVSAPVSDEVRARFEEAGAQLTDCSYHARPFAYWAHIRRVRRKYDVLLAQVRFFDYFTLIFWMCRLAGIRRIVFTESNGGEWSGRGWKAALVRLRTKLACRPLTSVIAISRFIQRRLIDAGIPSGKTHVVYNGVDVSAFHADPEAREALRGRLGADAGVTLILFLSALVEIKRTEIAIGACAELVKRGFPARLLIAGQGPMRPSLEAQVEKLGLNGQVTWLGYQPDPQRWLSACDVLLHTAAGEAFGNVLVEAMACGVPVVAARSGAAPELIEDGRSGLLVETGSGEEGRIADAIVSLARDDGRRAEMGKAGIEQARRFTVESAVEGTLAVFGQVTAGRV